jgi:diguanylate cyclase (GGDEF)-like protein/PAS domain S-box-containing protein
MELTEHQKLLETMVNSEAKALGQYPQAAHLGCLLLFEYFSPTNVIVWTLSQDNQDLSLLTCVGELADKYKQILVDKKAASNAQANSNVIYDNSVNKLTSKSHLLINRQLPKLSHRLTDPYMQHLHDHRYCVYSAAQDDVLLSARAHYQEYQVQTVLDVAIRINGYIEGILSIECQSMGDWNEHDIQLVSQVADQLALALATQRDYEKDEDLTLYLSATEQAEHLIILANLRTKTIKYVNPSHERLTGLARAQVQDQHINQLAFFLDSPEKVEPLIAKLLSGIIIEGEKQLQRPDGSQYRVSYHARHFLTARGNDYALVAVHDISSQYQHKAELERLAWHCNLTGLHNRLHFVHSLDKTSKGLIMLVDLLGFKRFNDIHGHGQGDSLLIEMARRIGHFAQFHQAIDVARVGSDEFAILLPELADSEAIEACVIKLYQQLLAPVVLGREKVEPKPAIAVVNIASVVDLFPPLSCADIALQHAKRKAVKHYQVFNAQLLEEFKNNIEIERDLQNALRSREFELYYQPLMDLKDQQYIGAEALIRWNHPKKGVLYPGAFIEIAEQTGMINSIGQWVLETACKQLHLWQLKDVSMTMHVNVSARQFFSGQLYSQVWTMVTRYRLKPKTLILEITETELMSDIHYATKLCKELAELGVGLAIDDFGTGHSSMRYLKQFPISKLKIDRSFVMDISTSHESREIVSAIIAMAKALNISLTAEGVETKEQEAFLTQNACHHAQGFLYSPAIRVNDFTTFLLNHQATLTQH